VRGAEVSKEEGSKISDEQEGGEQETRARRNRPTDKGARRRSARNERREENYAQDVGTGVVYTNSHTLSNIMTSYFEKAQVTLTASNDQTLPA